MNIFNFPKNSIKKYSFLDYINDVEMKIDCVGDDSYSHIEK